MGRYEGKYSLLITEHYFSVVGEKKAQANEFARIEIELQALNIKSISFQLIGISKINLKPRRTLFDFEP